MDISAMRPIHQGHPDRVNHHTLYPIAKGVWDYFSHDVVRAVDVRVEVASAAGAKHSAFDALAGIHSVFAARLQIEEAALGRIALLGEGDPDADQFRLVAQHLDETGMRDEDEVLV